MGHTIHKNHRRSITSMLRTADKQMIQIKRWAKGEVSGGVLYHEIDNLSPEQKEALLNRIDELSQLMDQVKDTLELETDEVPVNRLILGRSAILWESFMEMHSRYLKGYGDVSEDFAEAWDPRVDELTACMNAIMEIVSDNSDKTPRRRS